MGVKIKRQAHSVYQTQYHIVWIPKYRYKVLVDGVDRYLEKVMDTYLAERYPDVHIQERNIQLDYIHILIEIPPEYSVAKVIQDIKSNTSLKLRKKFEYLGRGNKPVWSIGYFVSTVGMNEGVIRKYIRNQEKEDKGHEVYLEDETTDVA
ncbi:IS200/IS605 family transposase [candidate division WWE3 bacterium CG_4_9_14_0_2_um_filter_35_11]|uniref:IS200/IS605 family transposase n=1 Tax=candidate division WWE3 bacterium CG_4_9_14_0_2_um_filter_35_11 TaxID=1975077 RepID=A0A2M8EKX1_UNCKA|nr:MAG: IS200/IS605 family transposase [candidate division WWE3 bacterium CG10_big_fil_rev_8_21_14_0_10_35_32]PJC23379.1 MAG: IS200/IS605 family transposase [candidate division WWE3 bacterium CG_4_9_14_0_2_um_filter_35_11]